MSKFYNEYSSKTMLQKWGLPTGEFKLVNSAQDAAEAGIELGFPIVMKIVSDQIIHKTEAGGIFLNVQDEEQAMNAYEKLISNAKAYNPEAIIDGVLISPMVKSGVEVIVGGMYDIQFGPVIMFGLGGVFVEIFKDVKFRMAPVDKSEAIKMIQSIQAYPMLCGARGQQPVNMDALAELLVKVSEYLAENQDVAEIDINPVICYDDKVLILDASIGVHE